MSQQINLYNPIFRRKKNYFSALAMAQALGLIAVGMIAFAGYLGYKVRSLAAISAQADRQLAVQRDQVATLAKQRQAGKSGTLADELARVESQVKLRRGLLASLSTGALGNVEGFSKYMTAFARQKVDGVWLTGVAIGGDENELQVRGRVLRAELVPSYLRALNSEEVMRGRRVTELTLNAVDESRAAVAPGQAGEGTAGTPRALRFVEFSLSAPRRPEEAAKPEPGEPRRKGAAS